MEKTEQNTDGEKRGKLILLSVFISLSFFIRKLTQSVEQMPVINVYLTAGIYFAIVFVALIWAFDFKLKKKSLLLLAQAGLFVASQELFIEFFFFQKFSRVYEVVILLLLILVVFLINYFTFLSTNVLNVDLFKKIPLAQIGRSGSFLITILMMYFFTFSVLLSEFPLFVSFPLIFIIYFIITLIHFVNIEVGGRELVSRTLLVVLICYTLLASVFLSGNTHEIISLLPVVGYYVCVNQTSREQYVNDKDSKRNYLLGIAILIISFFAVLFINLL